MRYWATYTATDEALSVVKKEIRFHITYFDKVTDFVTINNQPMELVKLDDTWNHAVYIPTVGTFYFKNRVEYKQWKTFSVPDPWYRNREFCWKNNRIVTSIIITNRDIKIETHGQRHDFGQLMFLKEIEPYLTRVIVYKTEHPGLKPWEPISK